MENTTETIQTFALNSWLVDYPSDWSYDQILAVLDDDNFAECNTMWRKVIIPIPVADGVNGDVLVTYIKTAFKRASGLIGEVTHG